MLTCHLILFTVIIPLLESAEPFDPDSGTHIDYIQHSFYDVYFYEDDANTLQNIKLTNNPNAIIQQNVTNADDVPEIRIELNWDFKFYGHLHNWISISPNGFLTTHPITCATFCNWWYETSSYRRYIAPLMSDFNPSKYNFSHILYYINNTEKSLNVEWHNLTLWQLDSTIDTHPISNYKFDFQLKLKSDGTIHFYYYNIPRSPHTIAIPGSYFYEQNYTTNIGLEDAAYQHINNGFYQITPLSPININTSHALHHHVVVFKPRPTCIDQLNCTQCQSLATDPGSSLECGWCPTLGICSDGLGREVFEYASDDFCTDDEMLHDLSTETCIDYQINIRSCDINDHVLAKYPSEEVLEGDSRFYSGVIVSKNDDTNTYKIRYDNNSISTSNVQYSWVHPCSTVSYDYSSYNILAHCTPHCQSILNDTNPLNDTDTVPNAEKSGMSTESKIFTSIGVIMAVLLVGCFLSLCFHRDRLRRRQSVNSRNVTINQSASRGVRLDEEEDDDIYGLDTTGNNSDTNNTNNMNANHYSGRVMSLEKENEYDHDANAIQVSPAPIISPLPKYMNNDNIEMRPIEGKNESNLDDVNVELNEIELQSSHQESPSNSDKDNHDINLTENNAQNKNKWDMTPIGQ